MVTVISSTVQKARKEHRCDSCGGMISVGEEYSRQWCVEGGDAWTYKTHNYCRKASQILYEDGIYGDDEALRNVADMDRDDRAFVYSKDPETYHLVWPDAPVPGQPQAITN